MLQSSKRYRAICFDLDGTLLPMDLDVFMNSYFSALAAFVARKGFDADLIMKGLKAGTKSMATSNEDTLNTDAFWNTMYQFIDQDEQDWQALFEEFYLSDFTRIGKGVQANPAATCALNTLREKGYTLALTTMPMFPAVAVIERLRWAGINPEAFARITTYENSRSVKPRPRYYAENLAALGLRGEEVLMVGNNTVEDLAFLDLGADGYVITDHLIDPVGYNFSTIKHGSMENFAAWCTTLPNCENPAAPVLEGPVDAVAAQQVLKENAVRELDLDEAARRAASVVEDPTYERAKGKNPKVFALTDAPNTSDVQVDPSEGEKAVVHKTASAKGNS